MTNSVDVPKPLVRISKALERPFGGSGSSDEASSRSDGRSRRSQEKWEKKQEKAERRKQEREEIEERRRAEDELAEAEEDEETKARYGNLTHPYELSTIAEVVKMPEGTGVTFRARIHTQRRLSQALDFLLFRDQTDTIQGVLEHTTPHMIKWVQRLSPESLVQVTGTLQKPLEPVRSASNSGLEVAVYSIYLVQAASDLPFNNYGPPDSRRERLSNRVLDLRHPSNQALVRIRSLILQTFRHQLEDQGFIEIQTPKLQPAATESGAEVFTVNYFGRKAFLAQSPQLAKQMAISADFKKVYEIGPVFRAENSNTHRHLTEFTGLDIEMALEQSYSELIQVVDRVLKAMFSAVQSAPELRMVRQRWPSQDLVWLDETPVITFAEGLKMLRDDGRDVEEEDLSTRDEIRLGELVKDRYKTDYYILDKFPTNARPFYAYKDEDPKWTNTFDIFVRGQEICTGGQRIHDALELKESLKRAGIREDSMEEYLSAFSLGPPPHGGAGLGLERLVSLLLDLGDVRYASLFHRDPKSLPERPLTLPHPEADTTRPRNDDSTPPIEDLIANYGDATNTSWLDDRFKTWRHRTGAAVCYVPQDKFAMIFGDPLCDQSQHTEVAVAFVEFVERELKLKPVWMLVSEAVQAILAQHLGWRTMSCTEEQRADADQHVVPSGQDARRVKREGIKIHEVSPSEDFMSRADESIEEWKASRVSKGKQVHLTEIRPWVDQAHRRYFSAEKDGRVLAMVVLAQLAPRNGWQVKWALNFPGAPNGTIEILIETALASVSGLVTFGVGVSEKLIPGAKLYGVRAKFLSRAYDAAVKSLSLNKKAEFREKFGVQGDQVYICYPKGAVSVMDLKHIVNFFRTE